MSSKIVPMIHVPDVSVTADWYTSIGFKVMDIAEHDGEASWALLRFGDTELMLNSGGKPSAEHRREVDLYVHAENVEQIYNRLKSGTVDVVEDLHDTFYGMREFTLRDCNRFWITFGEPVPVSQRRL